MTYQTTIIGAIVALSLLSVASVVGLAITGRFDAFSTPLIVTVLTGLGTTIAALLALLRADRTAAKVDTMNGEVDRLKRAHPENDHPAEPPPSV